MTTRAFVRHHADVHAPALHIVLLAAKARAKRLRKYVCDCGQIARGTRNSSLICGLCYEMHGEIRVMQRVDPLPEEILERAA